MYYGRFPHTTKPPGRRWPAGVVAPLLSLLAACGVVGTALTNLALAFGQDLLAAASVNYTPRYAMQVEQLLVALAAQGTGLALQPQLANAGYQPPAPDYMRQGPSPPGPYQDPYGQNQQGPYQDPYGQNQQGTYQDPSAQGSQQGTYQDPYPQSQQGASQGAQNQQGTYQDPYAQNQQGTYQDPYAQGEQQGASQDPYEQQGPYAYQTPRTRSAGGPISMNAVLLAQTAGSRRLVTVEDGDVLRDGRGDPGRGDRLKVHFQTSCQCYVYVIGIDATGYVANIFPDPDDPHLGNPVQPDAQYVLPRGDDWWGLDDYRGIEQVYFVASHAPREDLEAAMRELGNQPRQISADAYRPVNEAAVVPTRGMVKVSGAQQVNLQSGSTVGQVMADRFESAEGNDLVITRWFRHE